MSRVESWGGSRVLVVEPDGVVINGREARDLMAEAFGEGASMVAIPAARLEPAFFDLRSGVAGDILQVSVIYRIRLAIVGERPEPAASSGAFAALVRESNAGTQHWFVASLDALRQRLGRQGPDAKTTGFREMPG
jgi:hypothetical protein